LLLLIMLLCHTYDDLYDSRSCFSRPCPDVVTRSLMPSLDRSRRRRFMLVTPSLRSVNNNSSWIWCRGVKVNVGFLHMHMSNVAWYLEEKMLLCKQEEAGFKLNVEQADWRDDTDDEPDDQELEAHYMYMAQIQEVTPNAADNSGPIFDSEPL
nr:hypothetical protein [Tanacetum cinerariifolium]